MSVGGRIIEKREWVWNGRALVRYWVIDGNNETIVFAKPAKIEPELGDEIWWQSGKIYFDGDQQALEKVGNSTSPSSVDFYDV